MTEILRRIMNIAERILAMEQLSNAMTILFGIVFGFGLLNCVLGYRVLRFWMMLFGFGIGAAAGFVGAYLGGIEQKSLYFAAMAAMGILVAVISFLIYRAGIFLLGMGIGLFLSVYILHPTSSAVFFLCILIGVGLGILAMRNARVVIIVGTALLGGALAGLSLAKLGGMEQIPYGAAMSVGFAALGMVIQFAINKSDEDEEDEDYDEDEDEDDDEKDREDTKKAEL